MAISDQINELKSDISGAYNEIATKGGTVPEYKNTNNLATSIGTIPTGSGPVPTGTINITNNGVYNVAQYAEADVNVSGGGGGINNTKIIKANAREQIPANVFVGTGDDYAAPSGSPMAIPGAYANYYDNGGVITEENTACAVVWLGENEFLTIASPYTSTDKQNLQANLYSVYDSSNSFDVTPEDTYTLNWYPTHFKTLPVAASSPVVYAIDNNHFGVSYPDSVTESGTTYAGVFEIFELDRSNKTISVIDIFDLGYPKQAVVVSVGSQSALVFYRDGSLYRRYFTIHTGNVVWGSSDNDVNLLDLSNYADIQNADSYDIEIFSVTGDYEDAAMFTSAKVTTTPATNNYICATVVDSSGTQQWSDRTSVASFMDYIPFQGACNNTWEDPHTIVIGQKDDSTFLTLEMSPEDYSSLTFSEVQMRNSTNGYTYRGGWWDASPYFGGDNVTTQYGSYSRDNQVEYFDSSTYSYYQYDMFPSTYEGKDYTGGNDLTYGFYNARNSLFCTASIVITKAYVDPQSVVVGEEAARYFMTVFGTMKNRMIWVPGTESSEIFGVSRSAGNMGDLINVEVQA